MKWKSEFLVGKKTPLSTEEKLANSQRASHELREENDKLRDFTEALSVENKRLRQELNEARKLVSALEKYTHAAMEMQDLLGDDNSGIRINGVTSSEASLRKAISISQRMWAARQSLEQIKQDTKTNG